MAHDNAFQSIVNQCTHPRMKPKMAPDGIRGLEIESLSGTLN